MVLLALCLCFGACGNSEKKLNAFAKRVLTGAKELVDSPLESSVLNSDETEPVAPKKSYLERLEETTANVDTTVTSLQEQVQETKNDIQATKESVSETVSETKKRARQLAQHIPRSQKEANELAYAKGQRAKEWLEQELEAIVKSDPLGKNRKK